MTKQAIGSLHHNYPKDQYNNPHHLKEVRFHAINTKASLTGIKLLTNVFSELKILNTQKNLKKERFPISLKRHLH